jgi:putative ABC transport system permease protein
MLSDLWFRLRAIVRRRAVERDLDDELRFHVERHAQKLIGRGHSPADAARLARLEFGGLDQVKEQCRDARGLGLWEQTVRNLRLAVRSLRKRPGFAAVVVVTLALGIGANSAVFSAVTTILFQPLPYPNADDLLHVEQYELRTSNPWRSPFVAPTRLEDWQRLSRTFQAISGYYPDDISETSGEVPERIGSAWVAPRFLQAWGVVPALGRGFTAEEERFGGPRAAIISDRLWKRRYAADPGVIGRPLRVGSQSFAIVGVMPEAFQFPVREVDVWSPSPVDAPYAQDRRATWFRVIGRVRPGVTPAEAQADLDRVQAQLAQAFPATDAQIGVRVTPLKAVIVGEVGRSLWLLFAAVSVLLLIACTNIAALLLARTADRQQEISIRYSLGASRASIVGQLLTESLVLAVTGSLAGLLVAAGGLRVFQLLGAGLPRVAELRLDGVVVAYSLGCAAGTTLLFGLLPALRTSKRPAGDGLTLRSRTVAPATHRLQWLLVGLQVALAVPLLFGAGLLLRSFDQLGRVTPGFEADRVLTFRITGNWGETGDMTALQRRLASTLEALRALPGVEAAATTLAAPGVPFEHPSQVRIVEGDAGANERLMANTRVVSPGYFTTMQIPLLAGTSCPAETTTPTALVNRRFAALYTAGAAPIGRHVEQIPANGFLGTGRIVGVVGDAREEGLNHEPPAIVYWCHAAPVPVPLFIVRTRTEPMAMADTIRRKLGEIEPRRSVYEVMPLTDRLDETFSESMLRTVLLAAFAVTAVSLAAIGLYGTLSYFVQMRRREIGVRMALGAARGEVAASFVRHALRVSAVGCVAGLALAAALGRAMAGMLYGVSPLDLVTFSGVLLLVLGAAVASSVWPAVRASRIDPMRVLRIE